MVCFLLSELQNGYFMPSLFSVYLNYVKMRLVWICNYCLMKEFFGGRLVIYRDFVEIA